MSNTTLFRAGKEGTWTIERLEVVTGAPLEPAARLSVVEERELDARGAIWTLRGTPSYERYVRSAEQAELKSRSPQLGRPEATRAALIPIRKSETWWTLAHDERREIFEDRSNHIATGLRYLPAVARRLYHARDLGGPFDFLTWFEYAPGDAGAFEELVDRLRSTEEWKYVDREVDVRLAR